MARLLLDAHAVFWACFEPRLLSTIAQAAIADPRNDVVVNPLSIFELEIKRVSGRMPFPSVPDWASALEAENIELASPNLGQCVRAANLPRHHGDPWDRLLIAHALSDGLTIVTKDAEFSAYGVPVLW